MSKTNMKARKWVTAGLAAVLVGVLTVVISNPVFAQTPGDFSLQVSPSPIVATVKPGTTTELELKIRNASTSAEELKISSASFKVSDTDSTVSLSDKPPDISNWITYTNPTFTVQPGQWFTQKIKIAVPKDSGFSYSFAVVINRKNDPQPVAGDRLIKGSVAVFALINIDRPGATRKLDVVDFGSTNQVYEYVPAQIKVKFKNTGNSIVQPYGNIFIQHGSQDDSPFATLPVNESKGYILPGSIRTMTASWDSGFPGFKTKADGTTEEVWDWSKIGSFRIGQYTAKLVGVYNDGKRDIPVEGEVTFWVLPWKIILALVVVVGLLLFGIWSIIRKVIGLSSHSQHRWKP